ncbi:2-oxoglutarate dehydrogenase complex dihydrolipoyllysine-residue succinyltransferase [Cohnella caldifontis]|uniref:2-oxoglutarate dehydrogenase complex dihydrolipoyllysine-residue succinyltransferase n=1 Tax=Cohnella caldifontis TaxID=3027471 RepID=UPI0023ECA622|nr:2-oxoglutarate dehydrogenase complex dihydrolipoyllysine-residue succinyltransferase [Cohnella sp. YIM B05605]
MSEIRVPAMGESITEGTIAKWAVRVGEEVKRGDLLLELETDKVNLEISAEEDGVVAEILRQEGDTVQIGEAVGRIAAGEAPQGRGAAAAPVETAEAAPASAGPTGGFAQSPRTAAASESMPVSRGDAAAPADVSATPAARKLAREKGIDLSRIEARDPLGRVYPGDVRSAGAPQAAPAPAAARTQAGGAAPAPAVAPSPASGKPEVRQRMSRRRATIAKRLVAAQHNAAMLTTFNEVDMTAILDIRKRRKQSFLEKHEVGLGFMSFFTKAVVGALKAFPLLNAQIDGEDIIVKQYYDIGIAVAAKEGLVVPVVRDADRLGFAEIERKIAELAAKARSNALELADLQGGTFTITNGGVFGSLLSTPILNAPQVGILGMHKIQTRPVALDAERMANRPMMYVALSYDHRIVDGAEAVRFLVRIKEMLEDPETLLLEG